jgi:O-antigen ligase
VGIAVVGVAIFAMLCFALSTTQVGVLRNRNVLFALWAVLIGSEEVFSYLTEDTTAGFSSGAYSEAMIWVFVTLAFLIYTIRHPQYLKRVYAGSFKWVSIFATICLLSVSYAESKNYSLGWCYKMWLVIFLLSACSEEIKTFDDILAFLKWTLAGFVFLAVMPLVRLFQNPEVLAEGRLYDVAAAPTMLSADAAIIVLLALTLSKPKHRGVLGFVAAFGFGIMILAAGKTAIAAGILCSLLFFALQRKMGSAGLFVVGMIIVGGLVFILTPVSDYLGTYAKSDQAFSVTGRTEVWEAGWQLIKQKPILGRGFMSSRFLADKIDVSWHPEHLHDGFLEAWYNNGIFGLFAIIMIQFVIVRNLLLVRKATRDKPYVNQIAMGCFVVYVNVLINGLVSRAFGSRPDATFMAMFAVVLLSDHLVQTFGPKKVVARTALWQVDSAMAR